MTKLLDEAFEKARLLPDHVQDAIAALIFDELDEDREWERKFGASADTLARLAHDAMVEDRAGKTLPLEPEEM